MQQGEADQLRLAVLDPEDLAVVSAHLQDADATLGDMAFLPRQARFALVVSRFDWPLALRGQFARCRTGVHFERVLSVARNGLPAGDTATPLQLLALAFVPGDAPSGHVLLTFAGGGQIRLAVECLEAEMRDIGPRWTVQGRPADPTLAGAPAATSRGDA